MLPVPKPLCVEGVAEPVLWPLPDVVLLWVGCEEDAALDDVDVEDADAY